MSNIELYAVVNHEGKLYSNRYHRLCVYTKLGTAKGQAQRDGDSVVLVTVHLDREPLFIRSKKV